MRTLLISSLLSSVSVSAAAQDTASSSPVTDDDDTIVVTADSIRGEVIGPIAAELELSAEDVAGYGVSSISELLEEIAIETGSARGRGGDGRPIVLLNGQRISGFREIRGIPPEAIKRVQVFPEELALRYGFRPDQRVVNIILVPNFSAITLEGDHKESVAGGYGETQLETKLTKIGERNRITVNAEYEFGSELSEAERDIIQTRTADAGLESDAAFRSLTGQSRRFQLDGSLSRAISKGTILTVSGDYSRQERESGQGLTDVTVLVPDDSPFSRTEGAEEEVFRFLPAIAPLRREVSTDSAAAGLTLNGQLGAWGWNLTGNYSRAETKTRTDREPDTDALVAAIAASDPNVDPFSDALGAGLVATRELATSTRQSADGALVLTGSPLIMPAGEVFVTGKASADWNAVDSRTERNGEIIRSNPERALVTGSGTIDVPLTSRRNDVLPAIGDLSLNANAGYSEVSDFGGLVEFGYGMRWRPNDWLTLSGSVIREEKAPGVQQLGNPNIATPNVTVFDLARGETVLVDQISGGNPDLAEESRRDLKLGVRISPGGSLRPSLNVNYIRNRSEDVASGFPILSPEIEAAFPDRIVRGADGRLQSIDVRPVNFAETRSARLRTGLSIAGRFERKKPERRSSEGKRSEGKGPEENGPEGEAKPAGTGGARPARPAGRPAFGFGNRGRGGGGWRLALTHNWRLEESVLIRAGVPELDLLGGSATGSSAALAQHELELSGRLFKDGFGLRMSADYTGEARLSGAAADGTGDLLFGDLLTMDVRAFLNFDQRPKILDAVPFLKGSRISIEMENVFGGVRRVEDGNGIVPLSYQPGLLNPQGRIVELSFRKRF